MHDFWCIKSIVFPIMDVINRNVDNVLYYVRNFVARSVGLCQEMFKKKEDQCLVQSLSPASWKYSTATLARNEIFYWKLANPVLMAPVLMQEPLELKVFHCMWRAPLSLVQLHILTTVTDLKYNYASAAHINFWHCLHIRNQTHAGVFH